MKKQIKKEIAVIFKKSGHPEKTIYYKPIDIEIGYLDEATSLFMTKSGEAYHYLLNSEYKYGFGLRMSLEEFKKDFKSNDISLKEAALYYLNELKNYRYYFVIQEPENFTDLTLIAEDKHTKNICIALEPDLSIGIDMLQNSNHQSQQKNISTTEPLKINIDAKKLSDELKKVIIGQDSPIDDIVTIIWQNLRSETKNNILLVGPSGVGKTEIIRNITKKLNIPMASLNVTDVSASPYLGASITEVIRKLVKNANNDIEKASNGIIFIDEIDKKAGNGEYNTGVITTNVQDELLKLLEDNDYEVNISENPYAPQTAIINTKNITFICAGAFSEMETIKKECNKKSMGFNVIEDPKIKKTTKITSEDLIKYGLKSELVGRLHNIIELSPLSKEDLIKIMKNPNNKTIQEKINILNSLGINLKLNEEVYELLANDAIKRKTGARGLVSSVDTLFIKAMTEISQNPNEYEELIINKDSVEDNHSYTLVKRKK